MSSSAAVPPLGPPGAPEGWGRTLLQGDPRNQAPCAGRGRRGPCCPCCKLLTGCGSLRPRSGLWDGWAMALGIKHAVNA